MTDPNNGGVPAAAPESALSRHLAEEAARERLAAELRPANKAALFGALAAAGIATVIVAFDGCGDSGQIESVEARDAHGGDVALPGVDIELASPSCDGAAAVRHAMPVAEAVEALCYALLEETHAGWENNDGACGEFAFDVSARTITLDLDERFTQVESHTHEF